MGPHRHWDAHDEVIGSSARCPELTGCDVSTTQLSHRRSKLRDVGRDVGRKQKRGARPRVCLMVGGVDGARTRDPRRDRPVPAKSSERPRTRVAYKSKTYGSMLFASVRWNSTVPAYRFTPWFTPHYAPSPAAGRPSWAALGCVWTPCPPSTRERGSSQPTAWIANLDRRTPVGMGGTSVSSTTVVAPVGPMSRSYLLPTASEVLSNRRQSSSASASSSTAQMICLPPRRSAARTSMR